MKFIRLLGTLLVATSVAFAQTGGTIQGQVTDQSGGFVASTKIALHASQGTFLKFALTDAKGQFQLTVPQDGEYIVTVDHLGFRKFRSNPVRVSNGGQEVLNIVLQVGSPHDDGRGGVTVTDSSPAASQEDKKPTYDIKNFLRLNENFCTGGQPSLDDLSRMKAEGIKAIINLRRPGESNYNAEEESAKAKELGLRYFNIPVDSNAPKDEQVEELLKILKDPENRPVFIHCMSANRVGAFWMIRRVLVDNWKLEDALKEAEKIGLTNPKTREYALDYLARHSKKL